MLSFFISLLLLDRYKTFILQLWMWTEHIRYITVVKSTVTLIYMHAVGDVIQPQGVPCDAGH